MTTALLVYQRSPFSKQQVKQYSADILRSQQRGVPCETQEHTVCFHEKYSCALSQQWQTTCFNSQFQDIG